VLASLTPLDSIKASTKSTEESVLIQLKGYYSISRLSVRIHEAHGRQVKKIDFYFHARAVSSLTELRGTGNEGKWELAGSLDLSPGQSSAYLELVLPIVAANLRIVYSDFHGQGNTLASASAGGGLHCPRCSKAVTDAHGVCRQCGEVAFQCRQCRHINYEKLDAFLCVECGYCSNAHFSYRVQASAAVGATPLATEADRRQAMEQLVEHGQTLQRHQHQLHLLTPRVVGLVRELQGVLGTAASEGDDSIGTSRSYTALTRLTAGVPEPVVKALGEANGGNAMMDFTLGGVGEPHEKLGAYSARKQKESIKARAIRTVTKLMDWSDSPVENDEDLSGDEENVEMEEVEDVDGDDVTMEDPIVDVEVDEEEDEEEEEEEDEDEETEDDPTPAPKPTPNPSAAAVDTPALNSSKDLVSVAEAEALHKFIIAEDMDKTFTSSTPDHSLERIMQHFQTRSESRRAARMERRARMGSSPAPGGVFPELSLRQRARPRPTSPSAALGALPSDLCRPPARSLDAPSAGSAARELDSLDQTSIMFSSGLPPETATDRERERTRTRLGLRAMVEEAAGLHSQSYAEDKPYSSLLSKLAARSVSRLRAAGKEPPAALSRSWARDSLHSIPSSDKKKPLALADLAPQVQQLLDLYGGECKDVAMRLKTAKTEMQAIMLQLRNYQYEKQLRTTSMQSSQPTAGGRKTLKEAETNHCYRCAQSLTALLLRLLAELRNMAAVADGALLEELLARNMRSGTLEARAAARSAIKSICISSKNGRARVFDDLFSKVKFVLHHGRGMDVKQCLGGELQLLEELCLLESAEPGKATEPPSVEEQECWRESMGVVLDILRLCARPSATDYGVAMNLALPCLEALARCLMGPYPAYDTDRNRGLLEVVAEEVFRTVSSMWKYCSPQQNDCSRLWITAGQRYSANLASKYFGFLLGSKSIDEDRKEKVLQARNLLDGDVEEPMPLWLMEFVLNPRSRSVRKTAALILNQLGTHWHPKGELSKSELIAGRRHWVIDAGIYALSCAMAKGFDEQLVQISILIQYWCKQEAARNYISKSGIVQYLAEAMVGESVALGLEEEALMARLSVGRPDAAGVRLEQAARILNTIAGLSPEILPGFLGDHFGQLLEVVVRLKGLAFLAGAPVAFVGRAVGRMLQVPKEGGSSGQTLDGLPADRAKQRYIEASLDVLSSATDLPPQGKAFLLKECTEIISPPRPTLEFKIHLRRFPSQEEFFRGTLPNNPILASSLCSKDATGDTPEPTMRDLQKRIAHDLEMVDATELLELLVCGKIISLNLPVRVVQATVWKKHMTEVQRECGYDSDTDTSLLPAMIVNYRLAGVDGEATEEVVDSLEDPQAADSQDPEERFAITSHFQHKEGLQLLLDIAQIPRPFETSSDAWEIFSHSVQLIRYCTHVAGNRAALVSARAPGVLLQRLLEVLEATGASEALPCGTASAGSGGGNGAQAVVDLLLAALEALVLQVDAEEGEGPSAQEEKDKKELVEAAAGASGTLSRTESTEGSHLSSLLSALERPGLPVLLASGTTGPVLRSAFARLLPYLTYRSITSANDLAKHMTQAMDWESWNDRSSCESAVFKLFLEMSQALPENTTGLVVRKALFQCGLVENSVDQLLKQLPQHAKESPSSLMGPQKSEVWQEYMDRTSLPLVLQLLAGICKGHKASQFYLQGRGLLPVLHVMENLSSGEVGIQAENLVEAMCHNNKECTDEFEKLMRDTKERKKALAAQQRERALRAMGMQLTPSTVQGQQGIHKIVSMEMEKTEGEAEYKEIDEANAAASSTPAWMLEMEAMEEEEGPVCLVCQEGFKCKPQEALGIYLYAKGVPSQNLAAIEGENPPGASAPSSKGRKSRSLITSVTAMNWIHATCHQNAARADRSLRTPKSEWEGACLRNSRVQCNSILPFKGPKSQEPQYLHMVETHFSNLSEAGLSQSSRFLTVLHDLRLLMLRVSFNEDLRKDCGGGSLQSNLWLVPHQLQLLSTILENAGKGDKSFGNASERDKYLKLLDQYQTLCMETPTSQWALDCTLFVAMLAFVLYPKQQFEECKSFFVWQLIRLSGAKKALGESDSGVFSFKRRRVGGSYSSRPPLSIIVERKRKRDADDHDLSDTEAKGSGGPQDAVDFFDHAKPYLIFWCIACYMKAHLAEPIDCHEAMLETVTGLLALYERNLRDCQELRVFFNELKVPEAWPESYENAFDYAQQCFAEGFSSV